VLNGSANDLKYVSTDNGDPSVVGERFEISYEEPDTSNDLYYEVASLSPTNVISQSTESISERVTFVPVTSPTSVNVVASPTQPTSVLLDQEPEAPASVILGSRPDSPALVLTDVTPVKPATTELERSPVKPATTELERNPVKPATVTVNDNPAKPATTVVERDPLKPSTIVLERSPIKPATTALESSPLKTADVSVENNPVKPGTIEVDKSLNTDWSPALISTVAWYDASDSSTITTNASNEVIEVQDLSGNNFDVTPPSLTYNPTISSTMQNGKTLIEFDGTDHLGNISITTPTSGNLQVFIVCNVTNADHASDSILSMNSTSNDFQIDSASTNWKGRILTENIGSQSTQTGISIITGMNIWNASFDFGSSEYLLRLNGDQLNGTIRGNYTSKLATNMQLRLFSNRGANRFPEGQVAEVIIYEDVTEGQRQKVEGYLAHKWGLSNNLESNHPYKSSQPKVILNPVTNLSVESTPLKVTDVNSGSTPIKAANVSLESSPLSPAILVEAEPKAAERIDAYKPFILEIMEPEADIIARPASTTEGTIAFGTDTKKLYVFNQTGMDSWGAFAQNASYKYDRYSIKTNSGGTGIPNGYFATELSSPNNFTHDNGITISFWFKSTWNENQGIFGLIRSLGNGEWHSGMYGHNMGISTGTNSGELFYRKGGSFYSIGTFEDDKWYHITYTYVNATAGTNSGLHKVYVDGNQVLDQSLAFQIDMHTQFAVNLGLHGYNYNRNADANFSELAIWNLQLSDSEISSLYQNGVPQLLDLNPTAWYRMGDGSENASGTVIENVVSSDYQGKLVAGTNGLNVTYEQDTPN
jgi:hypothetical protein